MKIQNIIENKIKIYEALKKTYKDKPVMADIFINNFSEYLIHENSDEKIDLFDGKAGRFAYVNEKYSNRILDIYDDKFYINGEEITQKTAEILIKRNINPFILRSGIIDPNHVVSLIYDLKTKNILIIDTFEYLKNKTKYSINTNLVRNIFKNLSIEVSNINFAIIDGVNQNPNTLGCVENAVAITEFILNNENITKDIKFSKEENGTIDITGTELADFIQENFKQHMFGVDEQPENENGVKNKEKSYHYIYVNNDLTSNTKFVKELNKLNL